MNENNFMRVDDVTRETGSEKFSYANDYEIVWRLKRFADFHNVCLLLVHHTRKQQADDKFDMISGTNGLLDAADGAFMLQKEKQTDAFTGDELRKFVKIRRFYENRSFQETESNQHLF